MPDKCYRSLATNTRYLRGIAFESGQSQLTKDDLVPAQHQAAVEIDAALGKTFGVWPNTPPLVALIADLIGSAVILEYVAVGGNFGEKGEARFKPDWLRKKATQILEDLREHKVGILNLDGTYDSLYPQPSVLSMASVGDAKNIAIDAGLTWGQMAPGGMTNAERLELDPTRERRATELEAAYAGRYGV